MTFRHTISGMMAALALTASSAGALTVTFTHTGTIYSAEFDESEVTLPAPGVATVRDRDTFTLSYDVDFDPNLYWTDCSVGGPECSTGFYGNSSSMTVSFSSGHTDTFTGGTFDVTPISSSADGTVLYDLYVDGSGSPVSDLLGVFGRFSAPSDFLSLPAPELLAGLNTINVGDISMAFDLSALGYNLDCHGKCVFSSFSNTTVATSVGVTPAPIFPPVSPTPVVPPTPSVTPVPVPAPFLMLGMAVLGLIGFGRRARA